MTPPILQIASQSLVRSSMSQAASEDEISPDDESRKKSIFLRYFGCHRRGGCGFSRRRSVVSRPNRGERGISPISLSISALLFGIVLHSSNVSLCKATTRNWFKIFITVGCPSPTGNEVQSFVVFQGKSRTVEPPCHSWGI